MEGMEGMVWQACRQGTKVHVEVVIWSPAPLPPTGTIPDQGPDPQPTPDLTGP